MDNDSQSITIQYDPILSSRGIESSVSIDFYEVNYGYMLLRTFNVAGVGIDVTGKIFRVLVSTSYSIRTFHASYSSN